MGWYLWILLEVLHILVLYPTRQHAYRVVALAAMIYVTAQIYRTPDITRVSSVAFTYTVACVNTLQFVFTAYLFFAEGPFPDHWRRVRDEVHAKADPSGLDKLPSNFPLTRKFWWMLDLAYSPRMVGWVQEPRNVIPSYPPPSRRTFLWKTFLKFIINSIIADFTTSVFASTPAFDNRLHDPTDGPETYLAAVPLLRRVPYVLAFGIGTGASMSAGHNALALVCVGLGHSSPTVWPDIWGPWGEAYTVRKLWGKTWHQRLRPSLAGFGKLVANKFFKFPRGSNRSSYTQLYVAFFLSGLIHFSGDVLLEKRMVYCSLKFFLLQAVAITFEDFVIYLAKCVLRRVGIELKPGKADESWAEVVVRVVGYCWVTLWFCSTLHVWLDELNTLGFNSADRGPLTQFSLDTWNRWA